MSTYAKIKSAYIMMVFLQTFQNLEVVRFEQPSPNFIVFGNSMSLQCTCGYY